MATGNILPAATSPSPLLAPICHPVLPPLLPRYLSAEPLQRHPNGLERFYQSRPGVGMAGGTGRHRAPAVCGAA